MKKVLLSSVCLIMSAIYGGGNLWASVKTSVSDGTLTITLDKTSTKDDVAKIENLYSYANIVVTEGTISDDIIKTIVYNNGSANTSLTSLDLSGTSYTSTTFDYTAAFYNTNERVNEYAWRLNQLKITSFKFPKNITVIGANALYSMISLESVEFPENLDKIEESAFSGCSSLKTIKFNDKLTYIGKEAFANNSSLESVEFPANLDKIDDGAFWKCLDLKDIKLNEKLRYIGNCAFAWDGFKKESSVLGTFIIPASVKYIGPGAFYFRQYQDVYFMGNRAPVMPCGTPVEQISYSSINEVTAFSAHTLMCNNGFTPDNSTTESKLADDVKSGYANRENYINGTAYMAILHYPNSITSTDDLDTYYDTTRKYEFSLNAEGKFDNDNTQFAVGKEATTLYAFNNTTASKSVCTGYHDTYTANYVWPSQSQWMRSYITAVNGVKWDGVTTYRTTLTDEEKSILAEAGYTSDAGYTDDDLAKIAHLGTRMFVLANNDSRSSNEVEVTDMDANKWYTICVPFNMTKAQVENAFGTGTNVCLFNKVQRTVYTNNSQPNRIDLFFTLDVCQFHKCTPKNATTGKWDYETINNNTTPSDDDIVMYAHESYMIRPTKSDIKIDLSNFEIQTGSPEPTLIDSEVKVEAQEQAANEKPEYRFIGNYIGSSSITNSSNSTEETQIMYVPAYSYAYASYDGGKNYQFWFITDDKLVWRANKSIVQTTEREFGQQDYENFFKEGSTNAAKQTSFFGNANDNSTTSIENEYVIIAGENADAPIYSIDGMLVSKNGNKTGLAKGLYIQNGKKFAVK